MQVRYYLSFLLLLLSPWLSAKPLQLDSTYETFEHQKINLQSIVGTKPIYLKFWASWCLDCRHELPSLEKAYQTYRDQIAIFAVNLNINETDEAIKKLQQKNNLTIPILMDNNGTIAGNFEFKGTPFHVLINRKGEVVYTTYKDDAQLAAQLELLAKNISKTGTKLEAREGKNPGAIAGAKTSNDISLVYFSATWCDTYMQDVEPGISSNCINAIHTMDKLYRSQPNLPLNAYVTHLWTEQSDVTDYQKRFSLPYNISMDNNNEQFRRFKASGYPTLIVLKGGKETARFTEFDEKTLALINATIK